MSVFRAPQASADARLSARRLGCRCGCGRAHVVGCVSVWIRLLSRSDRLCDPTCSLLQMKRDVNNFFGILTIFYKQFVAFRVLRRQSCAFCLSALCAVPPDLFSFDFVGAVGFVGRGGLFRPEVVFFGRRCHGGRGGRLCV